MEIGQVGDQNQKFMGLKEVVHLYDIGSIELKEKLKHSGSVPY